MNVVSRHGLHGKASSVGGGMLIIGARIQALVLAMPLVDFVTSGKIVLPLLHSDFSVT